MPFGLEVVVRVTNFWREAFQVEAVLHSDRPEVIVNDGTAVIGEIALGATASNDADPFTLTLAPALMAVMPLAASSPDRGKSALSIRLPKAT